jgi:hypothetical protein
MWIPSSAKFPLEHLSGGELGWCRGCAKGVQLFLPSIALTTINLCPIASEVEGLAVLALKRHLLLPVTPCLVAGRSYRVRRIRSGLVGLVAHMNFLNNPAQYFSMASGRKPALYPALESRPPCKGRPRPRRRYC